MMENDEADSGEQSKGTDGVAVEWSKLGDLKLTLSVEIGEAENPEYSAEVEEME
jgi:hypothetical protein